MISQFFLILITFLFSTKTFASVSASRQADESFFQARMRNSVQSTSQLYLQGSSAWGMAQSFEKLDFSQVADVGSLEKLNHLFIYIRDSKFISKLPLPLTERRLSWLFPDDGCYIRAEMVSLFTKQQNLPETYKFFGFGDLAVKSANHPDGVVRWWYHVVPIYRVGNQPYVIDPSIDPKAPMTAEAWKAAMEVERPAEKFSICQPRTVGPEESCTHSRGQSYEHTIRTQINFLDYEWLRLQNLGRNPQVELGDNPPWLH